MIHCIIGRIIPAGKEVNRTVISSVSGFTFTIAVIVVFILVSVQFTLNMILRELKAIRIRLGADTDDNRKKIVSGDGNE